MHHTLSICSILSLLLCVGCSPTEAPTDTVSYPFKAVTTCGMVTDIVEQIAGDKAEVVGIMGENVDPHLYRPTRDDIALLQRGDIVFYSGLMLEGRMADIFSKVGRAGKPVYAVTENLDPQFLLEPPEFEGHWDPHVWTDVSAWSEAVALVGQALSEYDQANAAYYEDQVKAYRAQLSKLDDYGKQVIGSIPEKKRVLVTAHDAFGYFARAYGIEVRAVQGLTTESEAGVNDINELVSFLVENKVEAVFVESSVSEKAIDAVIEGAQAKGWALKKGGTLYSDAMGAPGTYEGTYIGMMDHNFTTIARELGGSVPENGFRSLAE